MTGTGISVGGGGTGDIQSNDVIAYNRVSNTCTATDDCGSIYLRDLGHQSTGEKVTNNIVSNFGPSESRGIYIDDEQSWVTVSNNILYGSGTYGIMYHGGNNIVVQNNIIDATAIQSIGFYQDDYGCCGQPNFGMTANVFSHNVVYSGGSVPPWTYLDLTGGHASPVADITLPTDSENLYFAADGIYKPSDEVSDPHADFADPLFVDPKARNYTLQRGSPAFQVGFVNIDTSTVGPFDP